MEFPQPEWFEGELPPNLIQLLKVTWRSRVFQPLLLKKKHPA
jgi:hypothetical protein